MKKEVTAKMESLRNIIKIYKRSKKKKPVLQGVKLIFEDNFVIEWVRVSKRELEYVKDLVKNEK